MCFLGRLLTHPPETNVISEKSLYAQTTREQRLPAKEGDKRECKKAISGGFLPNQASSGLGKLIFSVICAVLVGPSNATQTMYDYKHTLDCLFIHSRWYWCGFFVGIFASTLVVLCVSDHGHRPQRHFWVLCYARARDPTE